MILKLDTTHPKQISIELIEKKTLDKLVEINQMGSQILLPSIVNILKRNKQSLRSSRLKQSLRSSSAGWRTEGLKKYLKDITAIEVNTGPGSFTGTRVGVAIANALGFALNIPVNGSPRSPRKAGEKSKIVLPKYSKSKFD